MSELIVRQFIDATLGNSSYLVALPKAGIAAIIDPQRDVERYLRTAYELNVHIAYALDTHLHADFISGARELQARILAQHPNTRFVIGASAGAEHEFAYTPLHEGSELNIADWNLRIIETPGHTPEHVSFLISHDDKPHSLFSGGSLLVGGAGRTDHLGDALTLPLAHQLYHSLHDRLLALPDDVIVYPTHGGGSFCTSATSDRRVTTIGNERWNNPLALVSSEEEFIERALSGLGSFPTYFRHMRPINRRGARILGSTLQTALLTPVQVQAEIAQGATIIDLRPTKQFAAGHVPGSYAVPFALPVSQWVGWVVPFGTPLVLIAEDADACAAAIRQLLNIGYDDIRGYMEGIAAWQAANLPVAHTEILPQAQLRAWLERADKPLLLDVRFKNEYQAGHLPGARHIEVGALLNGVTQTLPYDHPIVLYCQAGNRATVAYALLKQRGFNNVTMLDEGFGTWQASGYETQRGFN